ncbi:MAG: hypothetical protein AAFY76_08430 [Cyanobacteria bacterium J06649_11]
MVRVGSIVKILYPKYAFELHGVVEAPEDMPGRWIIRLINNPLNGNREPLLLSLKESEIELVGSSGNLR